MLAAVIVRPAAIAVAVARAVVHKLTTVIAVFIPCTAVPLCVGGVMVTWFHIDIAADGAYPVRIKRVRLLRAPVEVYLPAAGAPVDVPVDCAAIGLPFPHASTRFSWKADAVIYAAVMIRSESRGNERKGENKNEQ